MVLGEVARACLFRPFHRAALVGQSAQRRASQTAQQRGLAHPVLADDGHLLAGLDDGAEILEQRAVVAVAQLFDFDRLTMQLFLVIHFKTDPRILARGRLHVIDLDLLDQLGA